MEGIEHQQRVLQAFGGNRANHRVVEQLDQRVHVVAAEHGAQQFGGALATEQRGLLGAEGHRGQVRSLDLGGIVDAGRHAMGDEVDEESLFAGRGFFSNSMTSAVCCALSGSGGMPSAARSATWWR